MIAPTTASQPVSQAVSISRPMHPSPARQTRSGGRTARIAGQDWLPALLVLLALAAGVGVL